MQKKKNYDVGLRFIVAKRLFFCFFLLCFTFLHGMAQKKEARVTLDLKEVSLEQVFKEITKQTGFQFLYSSTLLKNTAKVTIQVKEETLEKTLDSCLKTSDLGYKIEEGHIIISPRLKKEDPKNMVIYTGVVKDSKGETLPGVTILLKGTTKGVTTNADGEFEISIPEAKDNVLVFSFMGMKTREIVLKDTKPLQVTLEDDVTEMDEVVVNGLFTQNRNSYTGSVTTIKSEEIMRVSQTNLIQALAVLTPGMRILENNEQGANPNYVPEIIIRGTSSISASEQQGLNRPLIMLDGVEITLEQLYDLDMFDIDRVDVLKDASATAIYGDKASNGVIVVTRKRVTDSKLKLRYNFVPNVQFPDMSSFNFCNAAQKLELERMYGLYSSTIGQYDEDYYAKLERVNAGVNTDWVSKPLRNSWSFNNSLNLSGRGGGLDYSVTLRFDDARGVMKGDYRQKYGIAFYFSYRLENRLTLSFRSDWGKTDAKTSPYGDFSDFAVLNPYDTPKDENGNWNERLSWDKRNPLYDATTNSFEKRMSKSFSNSLIFRLDVIKGLYVTGTFNFSWSDAHNEKFDSPESSTWIGVSDPEQRGSYNVDGSNGSSWDLQTTASYNLGLNQDGSSLLTLNVGGTLGKNKSNGFMFSGVGFLKPDLNDISFAARYPEGGSPSGAEGINTNAGLFGNVNVIVRNRYFVDGSFRTSGNSSYGTKDLYASYWSAGIGWNIHQENFLKDSWVNLLRLRGSIGYVGNSNFSDIKPYTIYNYSIDNSYAGSIGARPTSMGNDELKAERQLQLNFGVSASFLNERLDVSFETYRQTTKDLLLDISMPPSAGISFTKSNLGEKSNTGYEWSVSGVLIRKNDIYWRASLNSSHTKSKIKKISNSLKKVSEANRDSIQYVAPKIQLEEGGSDDDIYAVRSLGIDPATGREIFIKKDGSRTFKYDPQDKVALGSKTPKFEGSFSTSFTYKRVSLNLALSFTFGGYIYNTTRASKIENIDPQMNVDKRAFTERWKNPGDVVDYIKIDRTYGFAQSERFVEKKNEINFTSIGVMYDVNPDWVKRIGLRRLVLGVSLSDIGRISTVKYERGTSYPYTRGINFTVSPTF